MDIVPYLVFFILFSFILFPHICLTADTLAPSQTLGDNDTLISSGKQFQLGFFSPRNSKSRYLGIWFFNLKSQSVVWVANRDHPLNDSSGVVKIGSDGNLVLVDGLGNALWSSNIQNLSPNDAFAQLLDSGNLVLRNEGNVSPGTESYLWQSFDYPTDTLLAGMKLGLDLKNGKKWYLVSWKSEDDPSTGDFIYGVDISGIPQMVVKRDSATFFRTGPWDGVQFSGNIISANELFTPTFVYDPARAYYEYTLNKNSTLTRSILDYSGFIVRQIWDNQTLVWITVYKLPSDQCDHYNFCGANGICNISDYTRCSCLTGYEPKSKLEWGLGNWSSGCARKDPLDCPVGEGFIEIVGAKKPDLLEFWVDSSFSLEECRDRCLKNCSCRAYADTNATGAGGGCLLWFGNLLDVKLGGFGGQRIFLRVTSSYLVHSNKKKRPVVAIVSISVALAVLSIAAAYLIWRMRKSRKGVPPDHISISREDENLELPIIDFVSISEATNNFSSSNKIGQGGFGPVYKGCLPNGQEIAVKRLSENSRQGLTEFKNEVILIAKLQHRNLVKLLGCCIDGDERMLIYEYMPNKSLDSFIFGNASSPLVWRRRFNIIVGIARGLLYLHRDSRLTIIHRDLKASNVLLDAEMNPKISDFGMARAFGGDQATEISTARVVGTYGYMPPEYAIDGLFSIKSDIFSFGVLMLEIVSGQRNRKFHHPDHDFNLLGHAWKLWVEGRAFELIDSQMEDSFPMSEVLRCIQVGLLCVQRHAEDRPTMSSVLLMLDSETAMLPQPKQPGFCSERSLYTSEEARKLETQEELVTMSMTLIEGR